MINSPVIGPDGTIYTGSVWDEQLVPKACISAVNPDGTFKWRFETPFIEDQSVSTPAVGPEGNVYVGTGTGVFYALSNNGVELWRYEASTNIETHPLIAPNGTVYMKMDSTLFAFSPSGKQLWQFPLATDSPSSPALAIDGTIYIQGSSQFYALNPDGSIKWNVSVWDSGNTPAVAPDGTIIRGDLTSMRALNPENGATIWNVWKGIAPYGSPAIDSQGNIYAVDEMYVRKFSPTGQMLWERLFLYDGNRIESTYSAPVIDPSGRLYFGLGSGKRYALNSAKGLVIYDAGTGNKLLNFLLPETPSTSTPAIGSDGTLYIGCLDGKLYALEDGWTHIAPASFELFRGFLVGGTLASLTLSDDDRMILRPGIVLSTLEHPIQLVLTGTAPVSNPGQMRFTIESHASAPNIRQFVEAYDYDATTWVEIDSRPASTTDQSVSLNLQNPSRFIDPDTSEVRARISYRATGPVLSWPWQARIDQAVWQMR